jgi:hypothetical protein
VNRERKPAFPPFVLWGVFLSVLAGVGAVFVDKGIEEPALLGGAAAFILVLAFLLAISRRSVQVEGGGTDPDGSPATVWLACSIGLTVLGAALGPWLAFIGGGMTIVGVGGVVRELRAQRAAGRGEFSNKRLASTAGPHPPPLRQVEVGAAPRAGGEER